MPTNNAGRNNNGLQRTAPTLLWIEVLELPIERVRVIPVDQMFEK